MKTVDAYIRVSTKHQLRDDDTGSLASQELKIRQYCQLNNLSLQRIFVDEGKSGKNTNRPALQNLLKRIESGHTDGVVVYTLSRFSRSVRDLQNILHGPLRGKEFHSCQEKIDVNTAFGQFFLTILGALAEMERKMSAERTKEGLARRREMWVKSGISKKLGAVPYGYRQVTDKDGKRIKYEPDQDQQRILAEIRCLRGEGYGVDAIARILNRNKIPSQKGRSWYGMTVKRVLEQVSAL